MDIAALGQALSEYIPGLMIADSDSRILWSGPLAEKLLNTVLLASLLLKTALGYSVDELLGTPIIIQTADTKNCSLKARMISGTPNPFFLIILEPLQDFENPSVRLFCLETILEAITDGVVVSDCDGRVVVYNSAQENLEELHPEDMVGKFLWDAYHYSSDNESEHRTVFQTGEAVINKYQAHAYNNGIPKYVTYSTYPLVKDGQKVGVFSISKNETKLQSLLAETMDLKRRFIQVTPEEPRQEIRTNGTVFSFSDIIGTSPEMTALIHEAQTIALLENNVLIVGETGSGKEVFAQSMHNFSKNSTEPFIGINCAAIPENLLESILFGAVKGAYTGAVDHKGLFEEAGAGTLFLDELNSLPITMQSKLLRVLQERKVRRVGGVTMTPVRCRVFCATNEEPHGLVQSGKLRQDLFYRIAGLCLYISPLRKRPEDVLALGESFIRRHNKLLGRTITGFSESLAQLMTAYSWPGNTRELEHFIENLMVRTRSGQTVLTPEDMPPYLREVVLRPGIRISESESGKTLPDQLRTAERKAILEALQNNRWNISATARELGIIRQSLLYRMKKLHIAPHETV